MDRNQLIEMAKDNIAYAKAGTLRQVPEVFKVKADIYTDPARFEREKKLIFRRMPLMLAPTAELPNPGDYKAMEAIGVPVLLTRGKDGKVRAFLNSCTHRGTAVALGSGNTSRFICGYHGWTFNREGELIGVASREDFGEVNTDELGLKPFPVLEKAGLIWAILDPNSDLDINAFLSGYDDLLEGFHFEDWKFFSSRTLNGPNWKIAYDGYLDFYHLPVLHGETFGRNIPNRALFYSFGIICLFVVLAKIGPVKASLIMNIEPATSVLLGYLLLDQRLAPQQLFGIALIVSAVLVVESTKLRRASRA